MKITRKLLLYVLAGICILPVLIIFTGSLMGNEELRTLLSPILEEADGYASWHLIPLYPTFRNWIKLILDTPEYYVLFWNSMKVVLSILVGQLVFAVPAAWGLARSRKKWASRMYGIYIFCMLLPFQVTMLSQYLVLNSMHMIDTLFSLIVPLIFSTFPAFIIYQSFVKIPDSILDAAKVDGANAFQEFFYIAVPIGVPGILAAMVIGFLEYWNMVEQPVIFLRKKELWPLSVYIPEITSTNAGAAFAYSLFSILPALLVFWLGKDYLAHGLGMSGDLGNEK